MAEASTGRPCGPAEFGGLPLRGAGRVGVEDGAGGLGFGADVALGVFCAEVLELFREFASVVAVDENVDGRDDFVFFSIKEKQQKYE